MLQLPRHAWSGKHSLPCSILIPPAHAIPLSCLSQLSWLFPSLLISPKSYLKRMQLSWSSAPFYFLLFQLSWSALMVVSLCSSLSPEEGAASGSRSSPPGHIPTNSSSLPVLALGWQGQCCPGAGLYLPQQPSLAPPRAPCRIICFTCSSFVPIFVHQSVVLCRAVYPVPVNVQIPLCA